jgi:hypothetical protein
LASLPLVLYVSLLEIFVGTFAILVLTDWRGELGRGFLSSVGLTALGIAVCAQLSLNGIDFSQGQALFPGIDMTWNGAQAPLMTSSLVLLVLYNIMVGIGTDKARRVVGLVTLAVCIVTLLAAALLYRGTYLGGILTPVSFLLGAATLGTAMTGMLLGHWYLVTPTLTVAPLARINLLMLYSLIGQAGLVILNAIPFNGLPPALDTQWLAIYWLRALICIAFPAVLAVLTIQTCKLKAHMSSTGFLYVALGCVLAGQIMSRYLFFNAQIPL